MLRERVVTIDGAGAAPVSPVPKPPERTKSTAKGVTTGTDILLPIERTPAWYGDNIYIRSGYRPVFGAVAPCFASWAYLHNQSVNIFTHLVPSVLALAANAALARYFSAWYPDATLADRLVFHVYLTACALCFGVSAMYHTLLCHSHECADLWVRLDYVSISLLILGSFVPGLYLGFYCEPLLLTGYLVMTFSMGALNSYLSMRDRYRSQDWLRLRLFPFLALGFSACIPITHAALIFPYDQLQQQSGLNYYYLEGVFMLTGVFFLATKIPERWLPGKFDYWGASHQIFHCFVVMGALSHLAGIMSGYDWNYRNQRCHLDLWGAGNV